MLSLTEAAANEIKRIQASRQQPNSYFRLAIKKGGCSGMYYTFELCQAPQKSDPLSGTGGDRTFDIAGITVILDSFSLSCLENTRLDYAEDLMGGGFRFSNPQAVNSCSCGLSFALKEADFSA